jgi:CheY-like chemotaxis protein
MEQVLIVEDDDTSRRLMKRVIEKLGFSALVAKDGATALGIFAEASPKIVVTDLRMPKIDGLELLHRVKRLNPAVEVVVVTAHGDYDTAIHALREGASDYLKKPIKLPELEAALFRCKYRLVDSERIRLTPVVAVVEDDPTDLQMLARVFEKEGWDVVPLASGDAAIAAFDERKIDVLVTDLRLPGVSGLELLRQLRVRTQDCEVIVVTGYGDEASVSRAMRDGAFHYLRKPIDLEQLLLAADKALDKVRLRRSALFKSRELELAREVTIKITRDSRILVELGGAVRSPTVACAQNLLEALPLGLLVVGTGQRVLYASPFLASALGAQPTRVDQQLVDQLARSGLANLSLQSVQETVAGFFAGTTKPDETVRLGETSFVYARCVCILGDTCPETAVVLVM